MLAGWLSMWRPNQWPSKRETVLQVRVISSNAAMGGFEMKPSEWLLYLVVLVVPPLKHNMHRKILGNQLSGHYVILMCSTVRQEAPLASAESIHHVM